jgi:hypothetical protein
MKTPALVNKVSFNNLIDLFIKRSAHRYILHPSIGKGYVQIFDLEKGLQTQFWDCCFKEGIEIYSNVSSEIESEYFTLAFFLNMEGLRFADKNIFLKENIIWDTVFIPAASNCKIYMAPKARGHCLSISFSKKWLMNNVFGTDEFKNLKEKISVTKSFSLLESMNSSEKKLVQDLLDVSWKKSLGSFYIKFSVLKIISDFFYKIRERNTFSLNDPWFDTITKVEEYLNNHLTGAFPNLKDLAYKFSISESTLRRHFKKRYGVNMSTYFACKKAEYAQNAQMKKYETNESASFS